MTSRERVIATLRFEGPDRIPRDLWTLPGVWERYGDELHLLLEKHPIDFAAPAYQNPFNGLGRWDEGEHRDVWGCVWHNIQRGVVGEVKQWPITDYDKLRTYQPPSHLLDVGWEDVPSSIEAQRDRFIIGWGGDPFERMQFLRGPENFLADLADDSPGAYELRDMVFGVFRQLAQRWLRYDVDAVSIFDDWGSQRATLMSPAKWREFFRPGYQAMIDDVKSAGKFVFVHSDGWILDLYDDLIEMGVDAVNSQLELMGIEQVAERAAGRITFWGEISRQHTLPDGTPDDVRAVAQQIKRHLFVNGGGLIGEGEAGLDTPIENVEALLTAWD